MYLLDKNKELFRKVTAALNPGGVIAITDQVAVKAHGPAARATTRLAGLALFNSVKGQTWAPDEITGWLATASLTDARAVLLQDHQLGFGGGG
jgi:hypothetical protein